MGALLAGTACSSEADMRKCAVLLRDDFKGDRLLADGRKAEVNQSTSQCGVLKALQLSTAAQRQKSGVERAYRYASLEALKL